MGRVRRVDVGGMGYHALNRANLRSRPLQREVHDQDSLEVVKGRKTGSGTCEKIEFGLLSTI